MWQERILGEGHTLGATDALLASTMHNPVQDCWTHPRARESLLDSTGL